MPKPPLPPQASQTFPQPKSPDFKIAVSGGEEGDSIFEANILGDDPEPVGDASSSEDYGEEQYDDMDDFNLRPQQLPLETILEENSK